MSCARRPSSPDRPKVDESLVKAAAERLGIEAKKAMRYGRALSRWGLAKFPVRPPEEVERLVAVCRSNGCGEFAGDHCKLCGCKISTSRLAIWNKAKMVTERCPRGLWTVKNAAANT